MNSYDVFIIAINPKWKDSAYTVISDIPIYIGMSDLLQVRIAEGK